MSGPGAPAPLSVVCVVLLLYVVRTGLVLVIGVRTELASERRYRGHDSSTANLIRRYREANGRR